MADDGLLLNFEVGDTPGANFVSSQYKGRWKERALSKKWDKIKATRVLNGPVKSRMPTMIATTEGLAVKATNGVNGGPEKESIVKDGERSLKRKRKHAVASSSNATPVGSRNFSSSSLFTSNPEITSILEPKDQKVTQEIKEPKDTKASKESTKPSEPSEPKKPHPGATLPHTETPPSEVTEFTSLGINPTICSHLQRSLQITKPTQIQTLAIPHLLTPPHHDTFLRAQTGSGKTLSFLLPILHHILSLPTPTRHYDRTSGLFALILVPTRELAKQTEHVLTTLTAGTWVVPGWLLGRERKKAEKGRLRKGVNVLVATPGRLVDHLETTMAFDTSATRWVVLDEGDRLVDMGFLDTVGKVLRIVEGRVQHSLMKMRKEGVVETKLPGRLVKILCSATLRGEEGLGALETIVNPVFLKAETETALQAEDVDHVFTPGELTQKTIILPAKLRLVTLTALVALLTQHAAPAKMIIFLSCTTSVDYHHQLLSSFPLDLTLFQLHGSLDQPIR